MRGRDIFMESLVAHGVDAIFGNPGTTENPLLDSLADHPELSYYTTLHEGVAVCAAGFYAQASGRTSAANVHVAPGLGNAIGVMYGALKAGSPVIVTAGQQDTRYRLRDPILRHDLVAMAAPVTKWAVEPQNADEMAAVMRRAFKIANAAPKGPVFVALPVNVMEQDTEVGVETAVGRRHIGRPDPAEQQRMVDLLLSSRNPAFIAGDDIASSGANDTFTTLVEQCGATVYLEVLHGRQPLAANHPNYQGRLPMEAARIRDALAGHDVVVGIGRPATEEVWFDPGSPIPASVTFAQIETTEAWLGYDFPCAVGLAGDLPVILAALAHGVSSQAHPGWASATAARNEDLAAQHRDGAQARAARLDKAASRSPMSAAVALHALAAALPDDVVIVEEAITASLDVERAFLPNGADSFYAGRGGGIGQGVAGALGVAAAKPDHTIVAVTGDGSAMYSIQALWSAAHHSMNIVFAVMANREYRILKHNLDAHRKRFDTGSDLPYPHMDLDHPALDFVAMATGMGVPARRATTPAEVAAAADEAAHTAGPFVIELEVAGKT
ncbi:MAG: thiamine pyrophosphate-binding protein [Actinomycetia bacterium]|nr:thiamine pyrophosphate-binding protein [Actinomycetes bacterium]